MTELKFYRQHIENLKELENDIISNANGLIEATTWDYKNSMDDDNREVGSYFDEDLNGSIDYNKVDVKFDIPNF